MSNPTRIFVLLAVVALAACDASPTPESSDGSRSAASDPAAATPPTADAGAESTSQGTEAEPASEAARAIDDALQQTDPFARAARLATLLPRLGGEATEPARNALLSARRDLDPVESLLLLRAWALNEPAKAAAWSLYRTPTSFRNPASILAVEIFAEHDPKSAADAVNNFSLLPGVNTGPVQVALFRGWYDSGEPGLLEYIETLGIGTAQQRGLAIYARRTAQRQGPAATIRWVESLPDEPKSFKLAAFRQAGSELAQLSPPDAVAFCDAHCDGPFGDSVRKLVAQRWAAQDGEAAMAWLASSQPGTQRDRAVNGAFSGWWRNDREGLIRWAEAQVATGVPDWMQPMLEFLAANVARIDSPEAGLEWVERIENPEIRERSMVNVALIWRKQDEAAADAWLAQSPLSEEAREAVRDPQGTVARARAEEIEETEPEGS